MATIGDSNPTLADWAKRLDKDGKVDKIVEILEETNEILEDMTFIEGNLPTGHMTTIRSGLPDVAWRLLNYGVPNSKSRTVQVTDACGMLEAYAEVDKDLADLNGNTASFRLSEDRAFLEAMNQEMAGTLFYGNTDSNPEQFLGLMPRYDDLGAANAENIVNAAGSDDGGMTSIWLVVWGPNTCHGIFPKGTKAGVQHMDKGQVTLEDAAGGKYEGYRTHYKWNTGFSLRDWRYVVRICNIDVSALTLDAASGANLVDLLDQAIEIIPNLNMGRPVIYANKTIKSFLRRQVKNHDNVRFGLSEVTKSKKILDFDGIPIKRCDQILNTESAPTAA